MTWEEKLQACQALCDHTLRMRFPGNWYVSASDLNVKEGSILKEKYGNGKDPASAVESHWNEITGLKVEEYLVVDTIGYPRVAVKWNGFMWKPVFEERHEPKP
jgi:hypothetical protein